MFTRHLFGGPRRPAVLLTPHPPSPAHSFPALFTLSLEGSCGGLTLFTPICEGYTPLQKSEADPLSLQPLPRSLQKPGVSPKAFFNFLRFRLLHGSRDTLHGPRVRNRFIGNTYEKRGGGGLSLGWRLLNHDWLLPGIGGRATGLRSRRAFAYGWHCRYLR